MKAQLQPWQLLLLILAGCINRRKQGAIEHLLNDEQRLGLAVKGRILGGEILGELATSVTLGPILWHRELVARNWDYSQHRKMAPAAGVA